MQPVRSSIRTHSRRLPRLAAIAAIAACLSAQAQTTPPTGRLLASNCFQCHGTNGQSTAGFDKLVGMTTEELVHKLKEMQTSGEGGIMRIHALGYSDAQLRALAAFFASQPTR